MIDFPIVDAHVHLWDTEEYDYPWLDGIPILNRPFLLHDYDRLRGDVEVERMVFVQAEMRERTPREESDWISGLAENDERLQAVVAWAPIESGAGVEAHLAALAENKLVKGVRRILQGEVDPDFCLKPEFVEGVRLLGRYDFSFDICINHTQMGGVIGLVERCPDVRFVLDHIGKPDIRGGFFEPWATQLATLARYAYVDCKVSGLVTEADHHRWTAEDLKPYIDHVIECFGFDRLMYGSDWPVACQASDYPRWVETLGNALEALGADRGEIEALFRETAIRVYRLE